MKNSIKKGGKKFFVLFFFILLYISLFVNTSKLQAADNPVISVNFENVISPINNQIFGEGLEIPYLKNIWNKDTGFYQDKLNITREAGFTNLRFGGNTTKQYNWKEAEISGFVYHGETYWEGIDEWAEYAGLLGSIPLTVSTNIHLSPTTSADWVRYANIEHNYNIVNWEMGNEEYIADDYLKYSSATEYINEAKQHCQAMKRIDPRIKCGIHSGFSAGGDTWSDNALFGAINPGDFDFLITHHYQPHSYFNSLSMFNSGTKFEKNINLESGEYKIRFYAVGDQAALIDDQIPTLDVCFNSQCEAIDITSAGENWQVFNTQDITVNASTSTHISISLADDYYDYATKQDKNVFLADVKLQKDGYDFLNFELMDKKEWTYSFLASNISTEDNLNYYHNIMQQHGLDMPIYETEYGWQYGNRAYPLVGMQYDWRSGLFDALQIQSLIKSEVVQANLWTDLSTTYWRYYTDDSKGKIYWPRFYVFKLLKDKTGNQLVNVNTSNIPAYNAQGFDIDAHQNVPYLSVIASKSSDKYYINVVNRNQDNSILATIHPNIAYSSVKVYEIAPSSIEAHPYRDDVFEETITIDEVNLDVNGNFDYNFKPYSITTFEFFPPDNKAPIINIVTTVASSTVDQTPSIIFNSDEAGAINYQGDCGSLSTIAIVGNNQITFNTLNIGTYNNCGLTVSDGAENTSAVLMIPEFTIVKPICTSFEYTEWSACQSNNTQTRSVKNSMPTGCESGEPQIIRSCTQSSGSGGGGRSYMINLLENYSIIIKSTTNQNNSIIQNKDTEKSETRMSDETESAKIYNFNNWVPLNNEGKTAYNKVVSQGKSNLSNQNKYSIAYFIHFGTQSVTRLGIGERAGIISSYKSAYYKLPKNASEWDDVIKIGIGRWPAERNLTIENNTRKDLFKKIYLREANPDNENDSAAIMIMTYGLRPNIRNQASEASAIKIFKNIFKCDPASARDWDIIRAIAYSGAKR